jgi:tetratricopeptide (TPR) repeat protein
MDQRGSLLESRAMALAGVGALALEQDDLDRAEEASEAGLELLEGGASERTEGRPYLLLTLGHVALGRGDHGRATRLFEESLSLSRRIGNGLGQAGSIMSLASQCYEQGDLERATELYEEGIGLFREQGNKLSLAWCLINLGLVSYSTGNLGRAAKLTEEGVALLRELGAGADVAVGLCNLGWMILRQNDLGRAADLYEESLVLARDTGMKPIILTTLEGFACLAGAQGEVRRAVRLWGAARSLEAEGIPRDTDFLDEADARISAARSNLGEQAWEEALAEGREMTIEEAVSCALEKDGDR